MSKTPREFMIRTAGFLGFEALCQELGTDPEPILAACGLSSQILAEIDTLVSCRSFLKAMELASARTGVAEFGMLLGGRQPLSMFGPLGFAIAESPDARTAMLQLGRFLHLHVEGVAVRLNVSGRTAMWEYDIQFPDLPGIAQFEGLAFAVAANILRYLLGPGWNPEYVTLTRRKPQDPAPYQAICRCPLQFEAETNAFLFDARSLEFPLAGADQQLYNILKSHLHELEKSSRVNTASRIGAALVQAMRRGDCSLATVARNLGMTPRTLQRRLVAGGTNFQAELDRTRLTIAKRYLEDTSMPVTVLSDMLGYTELAAFSRAFKRLAGVSPLDWRQSSRASANA